MILSKPDEYGPPDVRFCGLSVWVLRRELEDSDDYWDGNWLHVVARYASDGAEAWTSGPIMHVAELKQWCEQLEQLHQNLEGVAEMRCMEPNLSARVTLDALGRGSFEVGITRDPEEERHTFTCRMDQSYLPDVIRSIEVLLERYPIKGEPPS
ncbi:MAG: hypothetical protein JXQ73_15805 [Phycisphaerae bacterium]|nr:hypothetical protein [Phycisphaerae bacterium]